MAFEFDPAKSAANLAKHGIDFLDAQRLWEDVNRLEITARSKDHEQRQRLVGRIGPTHWSAVFTYRHGTIRLISVRRSHGEEIRQYVRAQDDHGR